VYSLINTPTILDLLPQRSVVQNLLQAGFDVYLLDWGVPDSLDYESDLEIYLDLRLHSAVRAVCKHSGEPSLSLLGYCMGGTLAAMYTALHPERVRNLIMLAAPVSFKSEQLLYRWGSDTRMCRPREVAEAYGNAPASAFDSFSLLRSEGRVHRWADLYDKMDDEAYVEQHLAMDEWVYTNIPMAGAMYVEFIEACFQKDLLLQGGVTVGGRAVRLDSIQCPTLVIAGQADHLVPPETACPMADVVAGADRIVFPAGHVGLTVSRGANQKLWPEAGQWIAQHSKEV
jgi:polyhydroxyalkanoate synthase